MLAVKSTLRTNFRGATTASLGRNSNTLISRRVGNPVNPVSTYGSATQGIGNVFSALAGARKFPNVFA